MDIEKEREAFEAWFESRYDAHFMQFALDLDLYVDKHTQASWEAWQAAQAVQELTNKMIVAIELEVENQLKASAIDADPFRLDGEKIWYAALAAQEQK